MEKSFTIKLDKKDLLKQERGVRREIMLDVPTKRNQVFKSKKSYTRKTKHKEEGE